MSQQSEIYRNYKSKIDAKNALIGGEPEFASLYEFPNNGIPADTQFFDNARKVGVRFYEWIDGRICRIQSKTSNYPGHSTNGYNVTIFKNLKHAEGYVEPMSFNRYFEFGVN